MIYKDEQETISFWVHDTPTRVCDLSVPYVNIEGVREELFVTYRKLDKEAGVTRSQWNKNYHCFGSMPVTWLMYRNALVGGGESNS